MLARTTNILMDRVPRLRDVALRLARSIHNWVLSGGDRRRDGVDLLHGTWLGHPLHPVLTDIVVGAWGLTPVLDLLARGGDSRRAERMADSTAAIGTIAAVPTIITGLADYSTIPRGSAGTGLVHATLNLISLVLFTLSLRARRRGHRSQGVLLSAAGLSVATLSAYLGGHLVYDRQVGVNHSGWVREPESWTPVLAEDALPEKEPKRVEVAGHPVLLYRENGRVYAIGAVCPHAGGPLEEGSFYDGCVQCPWHDSVFKLDNGAIVHGPTTYTVPDYDVRHRNGQIELRLAWAEGEADGHQQGVKGQVSEPSGMAS